ncbi:MAG: RNA-directed DNA polymerase [Chryseobacterium sp.]|nr:MAG: RNA-directed DNA polymerase [Chryseobacterium sp.]
MITEKDKEYIDIAFHKMRNREDLLSLLNYAKTILFGQEASQIALHQLSYYANPKAGGKRYHTFRIAKKTGGSRKIHAPVEGLRVIQQCLNLILKCVYKTQQQAHGFAQGKSIKTNAAMHVGSYYVFNIDLKDFFPSIDQARVWKVLQLEPFNLLNREPAEQEGIDNYEIANLTAALCCTSMMVERIDEEGELIKVRRNVLPQGAPTSPLLSNVICQRLDFLLAGVAKRFGLKYSRFADDITFSSLHNVFQSHSPFTKELTRIIYDQGFRINEQKVRLQRSAYRQMVTGIVVNEKTNLTKKYLVSLRKWIYLWETYGFARTLEIYRQEYKLEQIKPLDIDLVAILRGKIAFLKNVLGDTNPRYKQYKYRFDALNAPTLAENMPVQGDAREMAKKLDRIDELLKSNKIPSVDASIEELREFVSLVHLRSEIPLIDNPSKETNLEDDIHDPRFVVSLLSKFTEETNLKYTVHMWDSENRYGSFQDFSSAIFADIRQYKLRSLPRYNSRLYWKIIYPFIIQEHTLKKKSGEPFEYAWGRYNLKLGYHYPSTLAQWMDSNPNKSPFMMPISKDLRPAEPIKGRSISYFEDVVDIFKQAIEFRGNDLYYLFKELTGSLLFDFNIELLNLKGISFFTDTHQVEKALRIIFSSIRKYTESPQIRVSGTYISEAHYFDIEILQLGSFCDKPIDDPKITLKGNKGDFNTIRTLLHSLCNWSVESRFRVGDKYKFYRLNYLNSSASDEIEEMDAAEGFKHRLRFYI